MKRLTMSKCSRKGDCSLKLILILIFDPENLAFCSFNVFQCSRTNCSFKNPGSVEYAPRRLIVSKSATVFTVATIARWRRAMPVKWKAP